jgi:CBS domain-containing protein
MLWRMLRVLAVIFGVFFWLWSLSYSSRMPPPGNNEFIISGTYVQDFISASGVVIREDKYGAPYNIASCFLGMKIAEKNIYVFFTANHFYEETRYSDSVKVFFNGRVYRGLNIVLPEPSSDIAAIVVTGRFLGEFPEPLALGRQLEIDDEVFIDGIHYHRIESSPDLPEVPIFKIYYGYDWTKSEFFHEYLEGKVSALNVLSVRRDDPKTYNGNYTKMNIASRHDSGFQGLSGGAVLNKNGQLVGIISRYNTFEYSNVLSVNQFEIERLMEYIYFMFG